MTILRNEQYVSKIPRSYVRNILITCLLDISKFQSPKKCVLFFIPMTLCRNVNSLCYLYINKAGENKKASFGPHST